MTVGQLRIAVFRNPGEPEAGMRPGHIPRPDRIARDFSMTEPTLRETEQIRQDCARKLFPVETSSMLVHGERQIVEQVEWSKM